MIIVKVDAGLCNQMYFFSTGYALAREWGEELVIDPDIDGNMEWIYFLDEFKMPPMKKIIYPLRYNIKKEFAKMPSKVKERIVVIDETYFEEDGEYLTVPKEKFMSEFPGKDIYLLGTFLSRQMFVKYIAELREFFVLKEPSEFVSEFEKSIADVTAVGVHIRRQGFAVLGDSNSMEYFMAAVVYMRNRYSNARFYIFSDELDYVKENLGTAEDIFYMDAMNGYKGDIEEFICLTKCHHYILTRRSTYGRMAEILNTNPKKISVLYGANTGNESEERFHFLSEADVLDLSRHFHKKSVFFGGLEEKIEGKSGEALKKALIGIGLDSESVTNHDRRKILYLRAQLYAQEEKYGMAIHLCRQLEEQFGLDSREFHRFYGDVLCRYGREREAALEYASIFDKDRIQKLIHENKILNDCWRLCDKSGRKHFIIVPFRHFASQYMSELQVIGLILARMGNKVSFLIKRNVLESSNDMSNVRIKAWERNVDNKYAEILLEKGFLMERFYYGYPCYDFAEIVENKQDSLQQIADRYPDMETIILSRDPQMISDDVPFRKVFTDYSEPFDEAYLKNEVGMSNIEAMYECADIVVTGEKNNYVMKKTLIRIEDNLLDKPELYVEKEMPFYEPTLYTEDYLDMALKIAICCQM